MMRKPAPSILSFLSLLIPLSPSLLADENQAGVNIQHTQNFSPSLEKAEKKIAPFEPFTGKITKNKVRLRLHPTYDGFILREYNQNDLLVINGETEDFYTAQPPKDIKGFVFRTYILDNIVEGSRVNVRLQPDLESPVIAQLNSGDKVEGVISSTNNKWLEIAIPQTAQFYIAKEYVEKIGDAGLMARQEKRKEDVYRLLANTESLSRLEMAKPFDQFNVERIKSNYQAIINNYTDFPDAVAKAKELLAKLQEVFITKKLAYLEAQNGYSSHILEAKNKQLTEELNAHKTKLANLEQKGGSEKLSNSSISQANPARKTSQLPMNMAIWLPIEEALFNDWVKHSGNENPQAFYEEQKQHSFILKGIVDAYNRPVKNKPGDYMLINSASKLPIAFLYSTQVNLQDFIGHEVSIRVAPRPNNHYAFPAYYVLSLE